MKSSTQYPITWSFSTWFTHFDDPGYRQFKEDLARDILKMQAGNCELLVLNFETLRDRLEHISNYLDCLFAANSNNEKIKAEKAQISTLKAEMRKIETSLQIELASLKPEQFDLLSSKTLKGAEYAISRMREEGKHLMAQPLEALAADLNINGLSAWGRLYESLAAEMQFSMTFPDGRQEIVPMAKRRALMADPNAEVRRTAFEEGQKPWKEHATTFAACINAIAGTRLKLGSYHHRQNFLEAPLFDAALSLDSLGALLHAIKTHIELPRRALRAAARLQKTPALHYCDLEAPQIVAPKQDGISWDTACSMVENAFTAAYPQLGEYFCDMLKNQWIEAEPRANKLPGAFCSGSRYKLEERVFMSFNGTLHDVVTLAHEVGHAWHSRLLRSKRSLSAHYPMTLAETASNFGEMLLIDSLMQEEGICPQTHASFIDQQMLRAHAYLINIPMRYEFEKAFYTQRAAGELSANALSELMTQIQRELYADTLLQDGTDPLFWAYKMHFYITDIAFYNFPYVFGYLLSQALFARFQAEGASFLPHYEAFLSQSASATCEEVAHQTLGVDLTQPDFWEQAIQTIEPALKIYEKLAD